MIGAVLIALFGGMAQIVFVDQAQQSGSATPSGWYPAVVNLFCAAAVLRFREIAEPIVSGPTKP